MTALRIGVIALGASTFGVGVVLFFLPISVQGWAGPYSCGSAVLKDEDSMRAATDATTSRGGLEFHATAACNEPRSERRDLAFLVTAGGVVVLGAAALERQLRRRSVRGPIPSG